jgi:integrase
MSRGDGPCYLRGSVYWVCYYLRGTQYRESTNETDEQKALKSLKARLKEVHADEIGARVFQTPQSRRLTVHDLLETLKAKFELAGQLSPQNKSHLKRADEDFGQHLAVALRPERIDAYKKERLAKGDKPASTNRVLQLTNQSYLLAMHRGTLANRPFIELLSEKGNARKGFCTETEFRKIRGFLPEYLKDFSEFAYCTGMRLGEVKSLRWEFVRGDVIELQAEDAKGDGDEKNARSIPMVGKDLAGILERRKAARRVKVGETPVMASLIFHHNGHAIVDIRKAWKTACKKAGVPNRLFHDLRRSAVKNMDDAGVSRDAAMAISGHKTQSMYSRYNVSDDKRKRKALELAQEFRERMAAEEAQESNVISIGRG